MKPLTPRERRLVAVAVLVGLVAVLLVGVVGPLVAGFADRARERTELQLEYRRNARLLASVAATRASALRQRTDADRFSVTAPNAQAAAEALKARIQRVAADEDFAISSAQEEADDSGRSRVRIRIDAVLTLTQLCDSLRRLESQGAYVIVDYLAVTADQALASGREGPLTVRLEFTGAWRPGRPS